MSDIVMYFIVREQLDMSCGKTAAQVGHATGYLFLRYQEIKSSPEGYLFKEWMNKGNHAKIVLGANEGEWAKVKEQFGNDPNCFIVRDAGHTEIPSGTETVIGIWPLHKADAPKILKRLQLLR